MTDRRASQAMLLTVVADCDLQLKRIAHETSFDISSVSRFVSGERNPPLEFWRDLFRPTQDLRLPNFVHGDTGFTSVLVRPASLGDDLSAVQALVSEMGEHQQAIERAVGILDGGITADDRRDLPAFEKEVDEAISALFALKTLFVDQVNRAARRTDIGVRRTPPHRIPPPRSAEVPNG